MVNIVLKRKRKNANKRPQSTEQEAEQRESGTKRRQKMVGSLPVANVQALASSYSGDVPLRYLRPELLSEEVLVDESLQIPTIDMRKLLVDDDEMSKLHLACKEWGFFQV